MKLRGRERGWLSACGVALYLSGIGLWVCAHQPTPRGPFGEEPHPLQGALRAAHTAVRMGALIVVGYMLRAHILPGWRARRRRWSGAIMCSWPAMLTCTGVALLYGGDACLTAAAPGHTVLGFAALVPLVWHARRPVNMPGTLRKASAGVRHTG